MKQKTKQRYRPGRAGWVLALLITATVWAQVPEDIRENLRGISDVLVLLRFQGIDYHSGQKSLRDRAKVETHLRELSERLRAERIPWSADDVRRLYASVGKMLGQASLRPQSFYRRARSPVPSLVLEVEAKPLAADQGGLFLSLVMLRLSRLASLHQGPERNSPVWIWIDHEVFAAGERELPKSIEAATRRLVERFIRTVRRVAQ